MANDVSSVVVLLAPPLSSRTRHELMRLFFHSSEMCEMGICFVLLRQNPHGSAPYTQCYMKKAKHKHSTFGQVGISHLATHIGADDGGSKIQG